MVSIYRGLSAESPSTSLIFLTAVFRPSSKSTNVSAGQSACFRSSRVTISPRRSSNTRRTWKGCSCNRTRLPCSHTSPDRTSTSKLSNRSRLEDGALLGTSRNSCGLTPTISRKDGNGKSVSPDLALNPFGFMDLSVRLKSSNKPAPVNCRRHLNRRTFAHDPKEGSHEKGSRDCNAYAPGALRHSGGSRIWSVVGASQSWAGRQLQLRRPASGTFQGRPQPRLLF